MIYRTRNPPRNRLQRRHTAAAPHSIKPVCRPISICGRQHATLSAGRAAAAAAAANGDDTTPSSSSSSPTAGAAGAPNEPPIEAVIADVLNASNNASNQLQRPSDLLSLLDSSGNGLSTTVRRSWDTTAVRLALEGSWQACGEARKMAMLAVYQERLVSRAGALLRLMRWVLEQQQQNQQRPQQQSPQQNQQQNQQQQPSLLDEGVVQQVERLAAADDINPAVQVLMVPQLTLLAAALMPWPMLLQLVEGAVAAAQQVLFTKPPYSYSPAQRKTALQQLQWVEASLCRGAALARLRALLLQQGRLQHWQQQADAAAAAAAGGALLGLTGEQAYHEWWKQQQQGSEEVRDGVGGMKSVGTAVAGRPLCVSFHTRDCSSSSSSGSSGQGMMKLSPGTAATPAAGAAGGVWDVAAAAAEQQQLCCCITQLTERVRSLKQQLGSTETALGVLPEVQTAHRAALLDALVTWADASPATQGPPEPAAAQARVAISSIEHDRLLRRIALEASGGPEVRVLRELAKTKGRGFLAHFSPTVGNPFGQTPEWDYFRDCPGVFARFVVDPPTSTATLTLKNVGSTSNGSSNSQQQERERGSVTESAADVEVVLSGGELQQLQHQLLLALSGSSSSSSGSTAAAAASSSGSSGAGIQLRPVKSNSGGRNGARASSSSSSSRGRGGVKAAMSLQGGGGLQLLRDGVAVAVLQPSHVMSLVTVFEDLGGQLPQQYSTSRHVRELQVHPAPTWTAALQALGSTLQRAARAAAAAALLALPLIAMARPFRAATSHQQPLHTTAATGVTTAASAAASDSQDSTAAATTAAVPAGGSGSAGVLLNDTLSAAAELQGLCEAVQQRVAGRVWLSSKEAGVDDAAAASILRGTNSSSSGGGVSGGAAASKLLPGGSSSSEQQQQRQQQLMYQVVVDVGSGAVLGLSPCTPAAAGVVWELPLAVDLKGQKLEKVQQRRAKAIAEACNASAAAGGSSKSATAKKPPAPSSSQIGCSPVQQQQQQQKASDSCDAAAGQRRVAVLKLLLSPAALQQQHQQPQQQGALSASHQQGAASPAPSALSNSDASSSSSNSIINQQQQRQQDSPAVCVMGAGKASTVMWLMQAHVTPWSDDDSLFVWASRGAVLQQQQQDGLSAAAAGGAGGSNVATAAGQQQGSGSSSGGAVGSASSSVALSVDGQEVDSMEAFVQQLIALSQQAQVQQQQ